MKEIERKKDRICDPFGVLAVLNFYIIRCSINRTLLDALLVIQLGIPQF